MTPFSQIAFPISKILVLEDKPVCRLLRNISCKSEFAPIKMCTINHVLCTPFFSRDPIPVVSPADVVNLNFKFTPLRSRVDVVKSITLSRQKQRWWKCWWLYQK